MRMFAHMGIQLGSGCSFFPWGENSQCRECSVWERARVIHLRFFWNWSLPLCLILLLVYSRHIRVRIRQKGNPHLLGGMDKGRSDILFLVLRVWDAFLSMHLAVWSQNECRFWIQTWICILLLPPSALFGSSYLNSLNFSFHICKVGIK